MYTDNDAELIDLNHLQIWECKIYTHILKERCQKSIKFDEQSKEDMLVEYEEFNIFRIWLSDKKKIV